MAKAGNHGIIIPRDKALLTRLYWEEGHSLVTLGKMFDVTHKSVERVFRELGIKRRKRHTKGQSRHTKCFCGDQVFKICHAGNKSKYGKLCKIHWDEHRALLARQYARRTKVRERRKYLHKRWYYLGPLNPKGEEQWISKSRAMLRNAKRLLKGGKTPEAFASLKTALKPERTSRV